MESIQNLDNTIFRHCGVSLSKNGLQIQQTDYNGIKKKSKKTKLIQEMRPHWSRTLKVARSFANAQSLP